MEFRDLIPWGGRQGAVARPGEDHPFLALQRDMNRILDDFWRRFGQTSPMAGPLGAMTAWGWQGPRTDLTDKGDALEVTVELPGLDEKDVQVSLAGDMLTIRAERKVEHSGGGDGWSVSGTSSGSFYRSFPLPPGIDQDKVGAEFKQGLLRVTLPRTAEARARVKRIEVKAA
jgi:HSP20 family protein